MSYNGFGQTTGISVGNVFLASYSYAPNGGLLQSMSYGNADSVEYAYDALARVSEVYYNESEDPALTYGYASNGALGSLTDHENERLYVYSYDGLDRLLSMTESYDGAAVQIFHADYDTANRVSSTGYRVSPTWNDDLGDPRAYEYTYSLTNGSLSGMTLPGGGAYSYTYDGLRRLNSRSLALNNSPFLTREYDYVPGTGANDTTTLVGTLTNKKGNGTTLDGWTYTYDDVGRITSISDGMETWSYTYDVQGQLLSEQKGSGEDYYSASYIYDTAGNIRSKTIEVPGEPEPEPTPTPTPDPTPTPTPDPGGGNGHGGEIIIGTDPLDPILPTPTPDAGLDSGEQGGNGVQTVTHTKLYTYGNAQWPDLLTAYDGHSISYDASGNPTIWYDGATMSWEHGRQLASVSATNDHAALSFSYDNSGLRLTKTVGTGANAVEHRYTWQGSKLIAEAFGDTELEFFYDESGSPYALLVRDSSTATPTVALFFYVTNLQGDVVMLLDASGNVVAEYSYNAWGEILSSAGTMADVNPIRYRGYYYAETGLYYLRSRYYDPEVCRFINADKFASTGQGILGYNMFAYCNNGPVIWADPNGATSMTCMYVLDDVLHFQTYDYILLYFNENSDSNLDGFALSQKYSSSPQYRCVSSYEDFVTAMNEIPHRHTNNIYIYLHSDYDDKRNEFHLVFYYAMNYYAEDILSDISPLSIRGDIYLFSCHGANLAPFLAQATGETVIASYEGVSYKFGYACGGYKQRIREGWLFNVDRGWWAFYPSGECEHLSQDCYLRGR